MDLDPTAEAAIRACPACGGMIHGTAHATGGATPPLRSVPGHHDPGLCVTCGTLLIWTGIAWRPATVDERTDLVDVDEVSHALLIHREYMEWRDADTARLDGICRPFLAMLSRSEHDDIGTMTHALTTALLDAGFHTHRLG